MKHKTTITLICIILAAAFLRLWQISVVPPGVNRDEASIGFTALSLLKTGSDEYGRHLPLSFESFGDWKLPLYIYTTVPFVATLGPTELAIRLPSALAGIATIVLTYFLVLELFGETTLALLSAAALSVSPWHLMLSRVESESNIAVLLITGGLLAFFKKKLPLAAILFALTYYTYHGNHITTTLLLAGLLFIYHKKISKGKTRVISTLLFLLLTGFILSKTLTFADQTKFAGISIFGDPAVIYNKIEVPRNNSTNPSSLFTRLRYNRVTFALQTVTKNYLASFSPQFLFFKGGGNHAHNIEGIGNFYLIDGVFLILGILALIRMRKSAPAQLMLWWLAISPVAASITKDAPHTNRMFAIFPLPAIMIALGIMPFLSRRILRFILGIAYGASIIAYLHLYHVEFPKNEALSWGYGYKKLVPILTSSTYATKHVIMSHPEQSPYIFFLLYMNYDPTLYQKEAVRYPPTPDAFVHVSHFGRFDFRDIDWKNDISLPNTLIIVSPGEIPINIQTSAYKKTNILLPTGETQFVLIET